MLTKSALINTLWGAQLLELTKALGDFQHFSTQSVTEKKANTKHLGPALQSYVAHVTETHLMQDMANVFAGVWQENALIEALGHYLVTEFWLKLDTLPATFGEYSVVEKEKALLHLHFSGAEKEILMHSSLQQIELQISTFLQELLPHMQQIIVEAPRWLDKKIRAEMRERYQSAILFFHINPALLGGLRIIKNGEMFDYSWLGKVQAIAKPLFSL